MMWCITTQFTELKWRQVSSIANSVRTNNTSSRSCAHRPKMFPVNGSRSIHDFSITNVSQSTKYPWRFSVRWWPIWDRCSQCWLPTSIYSMRPWESECCYYVLTVLCIVCTPVVLITSYRQRLHRECLCIVYLICNMSVSFSVCIGLIVAMTRYSFLYVTVSWRAHRLAA